MSSRHLLMLSLTTSTTLIAPSAMAETAMHDGDITEIVVYGRERQLTGTVESASTGIVGYADFTTRPLLRVGELVEVIPGMVATQHSGTGKANQYFLRGFNLDHGTDFAASFDGIPVNMRSHGHGQGYLDLNFSIPEIVEFVEYRKGTYHASIGDFSTAGSASFNTYDNLEKGFVEAGIGQDGYYRAVTANSTSAAAGTLLYALEAQFSNGPWVLDEDLEKYNAYLKYTKQSGDYTTHIIASGYRSTWNATDQIPARAVENGLVSERGFIDGDLGGETTRVSLTALVSSDHLDAQIYGLYYDFGLYSNFTYFLDDPINGDEFEQRDSRWVWGGKADYSDEMGIAGKSAEWTLGMDIRYDNIGEVGLYKTAARQRLSTIRHDAVNELSLGFHGQVEIDLSERLRLIAGARADYYDFDVDAVLAANSGSGNDTIVSPKLSLAYTLTQTTEIYANYGRGFHSNDVRGVTASIDPASGDPVDAVPALVAADGAEFGVRFEPNARFNISLAAFWLDLDSELVYVGDAGGTEVNDGSRRYGLELASFWRPTEWLAFDMSAAATKSRFKDTPANNDRIPGAIENVIGAGATITLENGLTGSLRLRHFGPAPLAEDDSVRSDGTTLLNAGVSYQIGSIKLGLDALNLLDTRDHDISYYYESQLPGELAPVEDIHYHPVEPFTLRASIRLTY